MSQSKNFLNVGIFSLLVGFTFFIIGCSGKNNPTAPPTKGIEVTTLAGSAGVTGSVNGSSTNASFNLPRDITVDSSGNVYVADSSNQLIRKITSDGVVSTLVGSVGVTGATNATGTFASFNAPEGVAVDSYDNIYVADSGNNLIRDINPYAVVSTLAGSGSPGSNNATGTFASFGYPGGVAVDSLGNVYVADWNNQLIRKITAGGVVSTLAGSAGVTGANNATGTFASFNYPSGVAVDISENVYVADWGNNLIREITPGGVVSTLAGSAGVTGYTNGSGNTASFYGPSGVAVDSAGDVYIADTLNDLIRKITP